MVTDKVGIDRTRRRRTPHRRPSRTPARRHIGTLEPRHPVPVPELTVPGERDRKGSRDRGGKGDRGSLRSTTFVSTLVDIMYIIGGLGGTLEDSRSASHGRIHPVHRP